MHMSAGTLDHYNVLTRKFQGAVQFYQDVLGFVNDPRPPFNFPGAWLYSAGHPVLHLNDISQSDKQQCEDFRRHRSYRLCEPRLRIDEAALHRVPFRVNKVPNSSRWQIFLRDPNNVEIELNFEVENEAS